MVQSLKPTAKHEIPPELLAVILSLNWSVQTQKRGNSQLRFWWPAFGQDGAVFRAVTTGTKTDKISKERQTELVAAWFIREGFTPARKPSSGEIGLEDEVKE